MIAYTADISALENDVVFSKMYTLANTRRRQKIDRMRFGKDKRLSLGVEMLLMHACHDFGIDYANQQIDYDSHEKPFFADSKIHFNLSHSEQRVMCVMASNPVGCDVEKITDIDLDIARRYFFRKEFEVIEKCRTQVEKNDMFFRLWTLKESFMKCTGLGFYLPLNEFEVSIKDSGPTVRQNVDDSTYEFSEWNADDGYKYAVCMKKQNCNEETEWKKIRLDGQTVL